MTIELSMDDFKDLIKVCAKHMVEDAVHPVLQHICIRVFAFCGEGKVEAVGMNTYTLGAFYCRCKIIRATNLEDMEVHHDILIGQVQPPKGAKSVQISDSDDGVIKITFDNGIEFQQRAFNDPFINYPLITERTLKKPFAAKITVNPKLLAAALTSLKGEKCVTMRVFDALSPIIIDGLRTRAICLPVREMGDYPVAMEKIIERREVDHE